MLSQLLLFLGFCVCETRCVDAIMVSWPTSACTHQSCALNVQVPSHLWEHFITDARTLRQMARHHVTKEPMPLELCTQLFAANKAVSTVSLQNTTLMALVDQQYFGREQPASGRTSHIWHQLSKQYSSIPSLPGAHPQVAAQITTIVHFY